MASNRVSSPTFSFSSGLVPSLLADDGDVDPYFVAITEPATTKTKGNYCYYTKKKTEAEAAHQSEGLRMMMLIMANWLSQPPVPLPVNRRLSISFPIPPEKLYLNSILTALPLTHSDTSEAASPPIGRNTSSSVACRNIAELAYAELAESSPSLVNGPIKKVAQVALVAIHGAIAPAFADRSWTTRGGKIIDSRLMLSTVGASKSGRQFEVVISGGGPVGLTTAMLLAHCTATSTSTAKLPNIRIRLYDQRWMRTTPTDPSTTRWRDSTDLDNPNTRRRQVITLQDYVVELLDEGFKSSVGMGWSDVVWPADKADVGIDTRKGAERVYVNSRQAPIRDVEDRLLREIRDNPMFSSMIELVPERLTDESFVALRSSIDLFVGADGASGKAFTVNHKENGKNVFEREVLEAHQTDRALGIPIRGAPTASQAQIVFLTLSQTIYLLNSTSNGLGFLNIRLSSDLYDALAAVPASKRTFSSLLESDNPLHTRVVALIDAGFRMYGMNIRSVQDERIDVFRLSLASAPKTVKWVTKDAAKGREGGMFPMVLVGDAAMQHNFWPGRGANSGLLSAWALAANVLRSFEIPNFRGLVDAHMAPYEGFMRSLKVREHDGRGRFIQMIDIERIYAQAFPAASMPIPTLHKSRDQLIARALLWRDRLGTRPEFTRIHPSPVTDQELIGAIGRMCGLACNPITRGTPMGIMDGAILMLLEGSQQWPTSDMNPLGYDLSPKGFIQPSYEDLGLKISESNSSSGALSLPSISDRKTRQLSWTGSLVTPVISPPEPVYAIDTDAAWLALALLGSKPEVKGWGDVTKSAEKSYKKALKAGYGTKFQKLHDKSWE